MNRISCLSDLPDELFLFICRYLSQCDILYSFYTPDRPQLRFHRMIADYYTIILFDRLTNKEYLYLLNLFTHSKLPLRPKILILSNEHITHLIHRFFQSNFISSISPHLTSIKLLDCSQHDLYLFTQFSSHLQSLEYLHIRIRPSNQSQSKKHSIR